MTEIRLLAFELENGSRRGIFQVLKALMLGLEAEATSSAGMDPLLQLSLMPPVPGRSFLDPLRDPLESGGGVATGVTKPPKPLVRRLKAVLLPLDRLVPLPLSRGMLALALALPSGCWRWLGRWLARRPSLAYWALGNSVIASLPVVASAGHRPGRWTVALSPSLYVPPAGERLATVIHDLIPLDYPRHHGEEADEWQRRLDHSLACSDLLLAVSEGTAERLRRYRPRCSPRVRVVRPSVSEQGQPRLQDPPLGPRDPLRLCCIGSLEPRKNLHGLLEGLSLVHRGVIELDVAGAEADEASGYADQIRARAVEIEQRQGHRLRFHGRVSAERKQALLAEAHALVYVPLMEGGALPILEAQLQGLPTLVSDLAVFRELVAADRAYFCPPDEPQAMAAAIGLLWDDLLRAAARQPDAEALAPYASPRRYARALLAALARG